jgi:hypothetical protein
MKIIVTTPKAISDKDKNKLSKAGYIVIETEDPSKIKTLNEFDYIDGNTLLMSMLEGLRQNLTGKEAFFNELYKRVKAEETRKDPLNKYRS